MAGNGQDHLYEASVMLQRLALYATLGYLMDTLGHSLDDWGLYAVWALFWAAEVMNRREGYEQGMVFIATLPEHLLNKIKREIAEMNKEE